MAVYALALAQACAENLCSADNWQILEGEVYITPADGEPGAGEAVYVKAGDYCVFPGGMSCT